MDPDTLKAASLRAYERGRMRDATLVALPALLLALVVGLVTREWRVVAQAGVLLFCATWLFQHRGVGWARGIVPGAIAGLLPLGAMTAARFYGHACGGAACYSFCIPACIVAGLFAGAVVGRVASRSSSRGATWLSATAIAVLTGALGCGCIGVAGLVGTVAGITIGSLPLLARRAPA